MKHKSEALGHGLFYTFRLSVIRDRTDKISYSENIEGSDNEMSHNKGIAGQMRSRAVKSEMTPKDKSLVYML
jgi:hypothetical protein